MIRIILTEVTGHGWLPTMEEDGKEVYRGEFRKTSLEALDRAEIAKANRNVHPAMHDALSLVIGRVS